MVCNPNIICREFCVVVSALPLVLIGASNSSAQPLPKVNDSVEWMAVASPVIVVGTIEDISLRPHRYAQIKMDVSETLNGEKKKSVSFLMRVGNIYHYAANLRKLKNWKKRDTEVLLFLGRNYYSRDPLAKQKEIEYEARGPRSPAYYYALFAKDDKDVTRGLKTMDLQSIKDYADLLTRTRSSIKDADRYKPWDSFKISRSRSARLQMEYVRIPVDSRLEKLAKRWLRSEEAWWQKYGTYALYHFPTKENQQFVETLHKQAGKEQRKMLSDLLQQWKADELVDMSHLLKKLAYVQNSYQWKSACRILGSRGAKAKAALLALKKLERADNPQLRIAAAATINKIRADKNKDR